MTFFDVSAKINIIKKKVIKYIELIIKQRPKLELVLYINYSKSFLGLYKDVEVVINSLKTRYLIFVVKIEDYDLILK